MNLLKSFRELVFFISVFMGGASILLFQNCSGVKFAAEKMNERVGIESINDCTDPSCDDVVSGTLACSFGGAEISSGETITAYLQGSGDSCVSEERTCENGALSGSYLFSECVLNTPASCLFNGETIQDGQSITAFANGGGTCLSEIRTCRDGSLSGSYSFSSCTPGQERSCIFNGNTIASGAIVVAYKNPSVPLGEACEVEYRLCTDGSFNGSYAYSSCQVGVPKSCLFNGQSIPHQGQVRAYNTSSVTYGQTCSEQTRVCNDGVLSGSYTYANCAVDAPASCSFNGSNVASGQVVKAYLSATVPYGEQCQAQNRTCTNGVLDGTYAHPSCNVDQPRTCVFNGATLASGQTVVAFETSSVAYGSSCKQQARTCDNGMLSGNYEYGSCAVDSPKSCLFNGETIPHGGNINAAVTSSVPYGQSCSYEKRVCNNGTLSGSATYASCSVDGPKSCLINGRTVIHGDSIMMFTTSSVPFGQSCQAEARVCNNGTLSGSASHQSCSPVAPQSCSFNGQTIAHGGSVIAFQSPRVAYGTNCVQENRSCYNGSLSGSYGNTACLANIYSIRWVNSTGQESAAQTCSRAGMRPASDQGYGICASGEARPQQGDGFAQINYRYGSWGNVTLGGQIDVTPFCYRHGQKQDRDSTDLSVAYLCTNEPQPQGWVNSIPGETQAQTCARVGLSPSPDQGMGICASGENRPTGGANFGNIGYRYGVWGSNTRGGSIASGQYCWNSGQKMDNDATDLTVAYLCR